ncbi:unnamed protein product, partial [Amoebophrya sp. A25]|eukprot:GSA25T00016836001.1
MEYVVGRVCRRICLDFPNRNPVFLRILQNLLFVKDTVVPTAKHSLLGALRHYHYNNLAPLPGPLGQSGQTTTMGSKREAALRISRVAVSYYNYEDADEDIHNSRDQQGIGTSGAVQHHGDYATTGRGAQQLELDLLEASCPQGV